jgi:hypothetical protein
MLRKENLGSRINCWAAFWPHLPSHYYFIKICFNYTPFLIVLEFEQVLFFSAYKVRISKELRFSWKKLPDKKGPGGNISPEIEGRRLSRWHFSRSNRWNLNLPWCYLGVLRFLNRYTFGDIIGTDILACALSQQVGNVRFSFVFVVLHLK